MAKSSNSSENTTRRRRTRRVREDSEATTSDRSVAAEENAEFGEGLLDEPRERGESRDRDEASEAEQPRAAGAKAARRRSRKSAEREPAEESSSDDSKYESTLDSIDEGRYSRERDEESFDWSDDDDRDEDTRSQRNGSYEENRTMQTSVQTPDAQQRYEPRANEGEGEPGTGRRRRRRRRRRGGANRGPGQGPQDQPRQHQPQGRPRHQQYQQQRNRPQYQSAPDIVTGTVEGILELHPKGYGFLRDPQKNYAAQDNDVFVSSSFIEKMNLREGVMLKGDVGPGTKGQGPRLKSVETIDGRTPDEYAKIKPFDELTAINPFEQIKLERGPKPVTMRVMDLLTPIGKGQRALIVAPPRTGKTMLLQDIADSVSANHPEVHLIVLLIDERPEEVTEMRRRVKGEVISSSMDREVESHVRISQLIIERAKRIAEAGGEVFVLLDSITRTARAFNKWVGNTGRTMSGGLDVKALDIPKKMFGTARRFDEGGSLTVAATALIDTGSRMDDVIFQEFKGTGNMELVLSRDLADRRIWPAIDITQSGTRREEKILDAEVLDGVTLLRRSLISMSPVEAMEQLIKILDRYPTNAEFLAKVRSIL